jgi:HicB family
VLAFLIVSVIQVHRVPTELHDRLRRKAEAAHVSLSAYVLGVLERDAGQPTTTEWLASLADREPVPDVDATALLAESREGLDQQFARVLRH